MADILIRGMEMPTNVADCPLNTFGFCNLAHDSNHTYCNGDSRPEWCPLVPIPEGHGRLIDADALKKRTPMVIDYSAGGFGTDGSIRPVRGYGDWQIDQAPTIVPAEGGTDNG